MIPLLLLLASACMVPPNVQLVPNGGSTYCELWAKVEVNWREAQARRWMAAEVQGLPFTELRIEDAGPLIIEERPFMWWDGSQWYDGMFWPTDPPRIEFNGHWDDADDYPILQHELAHFQGYVQKQKGWAWLGHGTAEDPYVIAANFLVGWLIKVKPGHPYYPGRIGSSSTPLTTGVKCFRALGTKARTNPSTAPN